MLKATSVLPAGSYADPADTVTLDFDGRHRRRIALTGNGGLAFLLDLPQAVALKSGDGLLLDDGRVVAVEAAPEPLTEVTAGDPHHLLRLAWHLGNRHLPAMIEDGRILIRRDHVISDMVRGLGGAVRDIDAPFDPEGGAYGGHSHSHSEAHGHAHSHSHGSGHSHSHSHSHTHSHEH
ncbi:urease accessory protein UreE [Amorphus orientalis]|uniref:Urease accessory protein UreE n=1 Tax=Amorphus orientalis TaxID=649198 RepID=A0AAE3VN96_9HYPH|nr:urease accessory protein UreE [Amorphus orientalis]MDQ0315082.1 urease accessory protein [Amorphus orientalis]